MPEDVEALNNLGNAYLELADHQRALEHYERARRLRPMDAQDLRKRGHALLLLGRLEEAVDPGAQGDDARPDAGDRRTTTWASRLGRTGQARGGGRQLPRGAAAAA